MDKNLRLIIRQALAVEGVLEGEYQSKISMVDGFYLSKLPPIELLNQICMLYGSTKKGRIDTARSLLDFSYNTPFIIRTGEIGAVSLVSSSRKDCVWIFNHPLPFKVEDTSKGRSVLIYPNGVSIDVPCSAYTVSRQKTRLYALLGVMRDDNDSYILQ